MLKLGDKLNSDQIEIIRKNVGGATRNDQHFYRIIRGFYEIANSNTLEAVEKCLSLAKKLNDKEIQTRTELSQNVAI